jgi:hypothetical protein
MIYNSKHLTDKIIDLLFDAKNSDLTFIDTFGALTVTRMVHERAFNKTQDSRIKVNKYAIKNKRKIKTK